MHIRRLVIPVVVLIAGCSVPLVSTSTLAPPTSLPTSSPTPLLPTALPIEAEPTQNPPFTPAATVEPLVARAVGDLAARLGVAQEEITVVSVEYVEWPDTSLGCPQPGQMYLQVITPGYRIVLGVGDRTYEYHSSRQEVILCKLPKEIPPEIGPP